MAFGIGTIDKVGGAVSDIFGGYANKELYQSKARSARLKAEGTELEAQNFDRAAALSDQNAVYADVAKNIKVAQADRQIYMQIGDTEAAIAGGGGANSGSALDILRASHSEGALTHAVLTHQGEIAEDAHREQAISYRNMSAAARIGVQIENENAAAMDKAASNAVTSGLVGGLFKGAAAIGSLFI